MSLYQRKDSPYWWISMWQGKRHIQLNTKMKDKRTAKKVENALSLVGWAIDGAGKRLDMKTNNAEGKNRSLIEGLLREVYGDSDDRTKISSLWDEYEDTIRVRGKKLTDRTLSEKKGDFNNFVTWANGKGVETIDLVTVALAKKYSLYLLDGNLSEKRRFNILSAISSVWNAILPAHCGITNPWPTVTPSVDMRKTTKVGFTRDEERKVLEAAKSVNPQWYVACIIARNTGLRYGDVCRLTAGGVDLVTNKVSTTPKKTKDSSGVVVTLPMSSELRETLMAWFSEHPRMTAEDRILPWLKERAPKGDKRFSSVLRKAGLDVKKFSFHTFRHMVASRLCEAGASLDVRKKILGHTTDVMADRYNHADLTIEMKSALEKV